MELKHLLFLLFISGALCCCKKEDTGPPSAPQTTNRTACFKTSSCFIEPGDSVTFTNCSDDFKIIKWDFGDGGSSSVNSPVHVFASKGVYHVSASFTRGLKRTNSDTTVYCGMQASTTFTFFYSDRQFPAVWPSTLVSKLRVSLYKLPDTLFAVTSMDFGYRMINTEGDHIWEVPLYDPSATYILKSECQIAGHTTGPDPNIDYTIMAPQGTRYTEPFSVFVPGALTKSTQMANMVLNYNRSAVAFK